MGFWKGSTASERVFLILVCALSIFYYHHFMVNRASVALEIKVVKETLFKLYWAESNKPFSEKQRAVVRIKPGKTRYQFHLTDLANVASLRIDPMQYAGEAHLSELTISQQGFQTISINLTELVAENGIVNTTVEDQTLSLISDNNDPYYTYIPTIIPDHKDYLLTVGVSLFLIFLIFLAVTVTKPLGKEFRYVPIIMAAILVLIIAMSGNSKRNAHPDEYVHLQATEYYQQNWLPPEVESEEIRYTYSVYGFSRLNNGEIYYLFAGKFSKIFQSMNIDRVLALRSFNVFLFVLITFYAMQSISARIVALPLIISPQIWYVFSYSGSDAFSIFLCFVAAVQIADPKSLLNQLLARREGMRVGLTVIGLGILVGLMLLMKKNYYPMVALFYFAIFYQLFKQGIFNNKVTLINVALISIIGISIFTGRYGLDYLVNGPERAEKIAAMQEETAHRWYKPSTELHKKHVSLYKKARGISLEQVAFHNQWFTKTFNSAFGVYGYFTISASEEFYNLVKYLSIIGMCYLLVMITFRGDFDDRIYLLMVMMLSVALIGVSLNHSWTKDFQPQGRYLFPVFMMLGVLLARSRTIFQKKLFHLLIAHFLVLAFYSYIFIGLAEIPRS